jgi:hypothetical protein
MPRLPSATKLSLDEKQSSGVASSRPHYRR